jgi:hypothetical protein
MAKKKTVSDESWGPFFDTYEKNGQDGFIYEQEVPSYREVNTPHGVYGVQPKMVLTFEDKEIIDDGELIKVPSPVFTLKKSAKIKPPKKTERLVEV